MKIERIGTTEFSGISLHQGDLFSIGVEAFFQGDRNDARLEATEIPEFDALEFLELSYSLRPPDSAV